MCSIILYVDPVGGRFSVPLRNRRKMKWHARYVTSRTLTALDGPPLTLIGSVGCCWWPRCNGSRRLFRFLFLNGTEKLKTLALLWTLSHFFTPKQGAEAAHPMFISSAGVSKNNSPWCVDNWPSVLCWPNTGMISAQITTQCGGARRFYHSIRQSTAGPPPFFFFCIIPMDSMNGDNNAVWTHPSSQAPVKVTV